MAGLEQRIADGIEYFLAFDADGKPVGARSFRPADAFLMHSVTDYDCRGRGYRRATDEPLRQLLLARGFTTVYGNVYKSNTRMISSLTAAGWILEPHPDDDELLKGHLDLRNETAAEN